MKYGGYLHRFWWKWSDLGLPLWVFRPLCWKDGGHEHYYKHCAICGKDLRG